MEYIFEYLETDTNLCGELETIFRFTMRARTHTCESSRDDDDDDGFFSLRDDDVVVRALLLLLHRKR